MMRAGGDPVLSLHVGRRSDRDRQRPRL